MNYTGEATDSANCYGVPKTDIAYVLDSGDDMVVCPLVHIGFIAEVRSIAKLRDYGKVGYGWTPFDPPVVIHF